MNLLELDKVTHRYQHRDVVKSLTLTLQKGVIGCLLGPSGCGKTTVLRGIGGFEPVTSGSITLNGVCVSRPGYLVPPERRQIGMVFQDYALFPHLTAARNVGFGLRHLSASEQERRIAEMLDMVGLSDAGKRYPHELSGGQQQRIALARALAPNPQLLLMDEPFSNLDVDLRERLCDEVRDILKRNHITAVLVTHDQHEAFAIADEVAILSDGELQQQATPYDLYHRPVNRFVAHFVGQGVLLPGTVQSATRVDVEVGALDGEFSFPAGTLLDVLLRPDDISHDDLSTHTAEVAYKTFRGAQFLYTLRLPSGSEVLSLVPSHHDHAIGERIGIRLHVDHVVAFPRSSA